jgi:hypothetical protein
MNRATDWLVAAMVMVVFGCNSKPSPTANAKDQGKNPPPLNVQVGPNNDQPGVNDGRPQPFEFLGNFIKALREGHASPFQLTVAFRKKIARPDLKDPTQQKLGYNPRKVEEFLTKAGKGTQGAFLEGQSASGPFYYGSFKTSTGDTDYCLIRLKPSTDPEGWQVDWFHRSTAKSPNLTAGNPTPDFMGAQLVAHEFIENLIGGDLTLAEAVMSLPWKKELYWSVAESNKDQGYDSKLLQQKMLEWRDGFVAFTITRRSLIPGRPAEFEGELINMAKNDNRRTFTIVVNKDTNDEWVVESLKIN